MFGPDMRELDKVVEEMKTSSKKFRVEDLGDIKDFFGNPSYERRRQNNHIESATTNRLYPERREISEQHNVETSPAGPASGPLSSSSPQPVTCAGLHSGQSKATRHNQVRSYREVVKGGIHPARSEKLTPCDRTVVT